MSQLTILVIIAVRGPRIPGERGRDRDRRSNCEAEERLSSPWAKKLSITGQVHVTPSASQHCCDGARRKTAPAEHGDSPQVTAKDVSHHPPACADHLQHARAPPAPPHRPFWQKNMTGGSPSREPRDGAYCNRHQQSAAVLSGAEGSSALSSHVPVHPCLTSVRQVAEDTRDGGHDTVLKP